jgi:WD40 repeat protein
MEGVQKVEEKINDLPVTFPLKDTPIKLLGKNV